MLSFDEKGWCLEATCLTSPNFDNRPSDMPIELIVIHNISLPPGQYGGPYISDFFLNKLDCDLHPYFDQLRSLEVSSHFFIRRDGQLIQFVSVLDRAWHAGASTFQGRSRCNDFSVGIEMEGSDYEAFTDIQYEVLAKLTTALCQNYPINAITGHQHIAPLRKTDPGPYFDWDLYQKTIQNSSDIAANFYREPQQTENS